MLINTRPKSQWQFLDGCQFLTQLSIVLMKREQFMVYFLKIGQLATLLTRKTMSSTAHYTQTECPEFLIPPLFA